MARISYLALAIVVVIGGCGGSGSEGPAPGSSESLADAEVVTGEKPIDIGDVEQGIRMTALLAPRSASSNVTNKEVIDRTKRVNFVTITVDGDKDELWLLLRTEPRRTFTGNPVAFKTELRLEVTMPGEDEATITRKEIYRGKLVTRTPDDFFQTEIDTLADIEGRPSTMLVQMETTALMTPLGTDPDTIDLDDFDNIEGQSTTLLGNPVRIEFVN